MAAWPLVIPQPLELKLQVPQAAEQTEKKLRKEDQEAADRSIAAREGALEAEIEQIKSDLAQGASVEELISNAAEMCCFSKIPAVGDYFVTRPKVKSADAKQITCFEYDAPFPLGKRVVRLGRSQRFGPVILLRITAVQCIANSHPS